MSQNQKMLKIMSFITLIAAFGMAAYAAMSIAFANTSPGLLLAICVIVPQSRSFRSFAPAARNWQ